MEYINASKRIAAAKRQQAEQIINKAEAMAGFQQSFCQTLGLSLAGMTERKNQLRMVKSRDIADYVYSKTTEERLDQYNIEFENIKIAFF
jgi:hypothetical protein